MARSVSGLVAITRALSGDIQFEIDPTVPRITFKQEVSDKTYRGEVRLILYLKNKATVRSGAESLFESDFPWVNH